MLAILQIDFKRFRFQRTFSVFGSGNGNVGQTGFQTDNGDIFAIVYILLGLVVTVILVILLMYWKKGKRTKKVNPGVSRLEYCKLNSK